MNPNSQAAYNITDALLSLVKIGDLQLPHRVIMAPLTRSRASQPGDVPTAMNAEYYRQRAGATLIVKLPLNAMYVSAYMNRNSQGVVGALSRPLETLATIYSP